MRLLLLITGLFLGMTAQAQTYAPYTGNKANETVVSKSDSIRNKKPKPVVAEKAPRKEKKKPKGDFQDLMNKAVEQSKEKEYTKALGFYTQALDVSTEETAWRALISRASVYIMMNDDKKRWLILQQLLKAVRPRSSWLIFT